MYLHSACIVYPRQDYDIHKFMQSRSNWQHCTHILNTQHLTSYSSFLGRETTQGGTASTCNEWDDWQKEMQCSLAQFPAMKQAIDLLWQLLVKSRLFKHSVLWCEEGSSCYGLIEDVLTTKPQMHLHPFVVQTCVLCGVLGGAGRNPTDMGCRVLWLM